MVSKKMVKYLAIVKVQIMLHILLILMFGFVFAVLPMI
jgi:hypothetical protein